MKSQTASEHKGQTDPTLANQVRQELETILADPAFRASQRLREFLRYVVEESIKGNDEKLKEYTIGIQVYKKPDSFDPRIDNIIRADARRIRSRLAEYYANQGREHPIKIELLRGRYAAAFHKGTLPQIETSVPEEIGDEDNRLAIRPPDSALSTRSGKSVRSKFIEGSNWRLLAFMGIAALLLVAGLIGLLWQQAAINESPSIMVLPFKNSSDDKGDEFFSDGLTDEIINSLIRLPGLRVVARSSAFSLKGKSVDINQIGKQFKVRSVLEGTVRRYGNSLRITAHLDDVDTGYSLWSQTYDREPKDILAIQQDISAAITRSLGLELTSAGAPQNEGAAIVDPEVYEEYLKGRFFWQKTGLDNLKTALGHFNAALAKNPTYAPAYVGLSNCYCQLLSVQKK